MRDGLKEKEHIDWFESEKGKYKDIQSDLIIDFHKDVNKGAIDFFFSFFF